MYGCHTDRSGFHRSRYSEPEPAEASPMICSQFSSSMVENVRAPLVAAGAVAGMEVLIAIEAKDISFS